MVAIAARTRSHWLQRGALLALALVVSMTAACAERDAKTDEVPATQTPEAYLAAADAKLADAKGYRYDVQIDTTLIDTPFIGVTSGVVSGQDEASLFTYSGDEAPSDYNAYETRCVDGTPYMRPVNRTTGKCDEWVSATGFVAALNVVNAGPYLSLLSEARDARDVGIETLDGSKCRHLTVDVAPMDYLRAVFAGAGMDSQLDEAESSNATETEEALQAEVWIDTTTGELRRLLFDSWMTGKVDIRFYEWGPQKRIKAPGEFAESPSPAPPMLSRRWNDEYSLGDSGVH